MVVVVQEGGEGGMGFLVPVPCLIDGCDEEAPRRSLSASLPFHAAAVPLLWPIRPDSLNGSAGRR